MLKNGVTPIRHKMAVSGITQLRLLKEQNQQEKTQTKNIRRGIGTVQSEKKPSPPLETWKESLQSEKSAHDEESRNFY